uniref:Uncharacterized protein n=1 Tax=Haemonchus contortus TaxID=6289 RepID=A0A7I5ECS6_HAECO
MHHSVLMLLLGMCTVFARPSKNFEMFLPADYRQLGNTLQRVDDTDQEVFQGYYDRPMARLQRKVNTFALPIKRIPRIGGTIVMG